MQHCYFHSSDRRTLYIHRNIEVLSDTATMKYLSILLVATAGLIAVEAVIPDYIHVCKRNDPQLNQCIQNSILALKEKLIAGIPELDVPKLDPLHLEKLILTLGPGVTAQGSDLQLTGGSNFEIKDLVVDLEADTYAFDLLLPEITARGNYEIDATIAGIPLKGKGPINLTAKTVSGRGTIHGKKVSRGGKTLYYFPSMDLKLKIVDYDIRLENLFEGDPSIGDVTNKLLNEEKTSILASITPGMEKAVIEQVLTAGNNICKHFTWEELFPET